MLIVLPLSIIFLTAALNPGGWWARFAPQLWLIPIAIVTSLLVSSKLLYRLIAFSILSIILFDILLVSIGYFPTNISESNIAKNLIQQFASSQQPVLVYYKPFTAVKARLDRAGVRYIAVDSIDSLPCPFHLEPLAYYSPIPCPP
jgi:hypothetical protein